MMSARVPVFEDCLVDDLEIDDESSFLHVALYGELKQVLRDAGYRFRILPPAWAGRWDRAQLLNLTFWGTQSAGDVLTERRVPADVIAHAAWHHLAQRQIHSAPGDAPTAAGLFLGEAIASAFDLYLVGRLLGHAPESSFLESQVPAMADAAEAAGMPAREFEDLLGQVAAQPERAFADLRELLSDAAAALLASESMDDALAALLRLETHRFAPLLSHYEVSNWVLYARAHARPEPWADARVAALERATRAAPVALDYLAGWLAPEDATSL